MSRTKQLLLASVAIVGVAGVAQAQELSFAPVAFPSTDEAKRDVIASDYVEIDGVQHEIDYHVIARSGDELGEGVFGLLVNQDGEPVMNADGSTHVSVDADFTSLLPVGDKLFAVTHFESRPGAMYVTELSQDPETGVLTAISTSPVDFSAVGGLWVPCAGSVTPWNTHLGSEEYEPDARSVVEAATIDDIDDYFKPMARYFGLSPETMTLDDFRAAFNPYTFGFPVEITVDETGAATPVKHYAMGRMALELAYVMPDEKTVYISDDGTNVSLFMFVADEAGDLDAGTLYAVKWNQTSGEGAGAADLEWIDLGHANSGDIADAIASGVSFNDIFATAEPAGEGVCPADFSGVNTSAGFECLAVKPGMETVASRLETRRYAALMGATTELRKEEGITFDAATNTLYVAMSEIAKGMEAGASQDLGGPDSVQLEQNKCGAVYALDVAPNAEIGSDYVAQNMTGLVAGVPTSYEEGSEYAGNKCDVDGIANPDNITFIAGTRTLIIGEDTGSGHQNDIIWAYNLDDQSLTRIQTTPYGSETTSPYFYTNINGFGYLMSVIQHPYGESDEDKLADPADARAYVGYVGPFPALQ